MKRQLFLLIAMAASSSFISAVTAQDVKDAISNDVATSWPVIEEYLDTTKVDIDAEVLPFSMGGDFKETILGAVESENQSDKALEVIKKLIARGANPDAPIALFYGGEEEQVKNNEPRTTIRQSAMAEPSEMTIHFGTQNPKTAEFFKNLPKK